MALSLDQRTWLADFLGRDGAVFAGAIAVAPPGTDDADADLVAAGLADAASASLDTAQADGQGTGAPQTSPAPLSDEAKAIDKFAGKTASGAIKKLVESGLTPKGGSLKAGVKNTVGGVASAGTQLVGDLIDGSMSPIDIAGDVVKTGLISGGTGWVGSKVGKSFETSVAPPAKSASAATSSALSSEAERGTEGVLANDAAAAAGTWSKESAAFGGKVLGGGVGGGLTGMISTGITDVSKVAKGEMDVPEAATDVVVQGAGGLVGGAAGTAVTETVAAGATTLLASTLAVESGEAGGVIGTTILPGVGTLIGVVAGAVVGAAVGYATTELSKGAQEAIEDDVVKPAETMVREVESGASALWKEAEGLFGGAAKKTVDTAGPVAGDVAHGAGDVSGEVGGTVSKVGADVLAGAETIAGALAGTGKAIAHDTGLDKALATAGTVADDLGEGVARVAKAGRETAVNVAEDVGKGIDKAASALSDAAAKIEKALFG